MYGYWFDIGYTYICRVGIYASSQGKSQDEYL